VRNIRNPKPLDAGAGGQAGPVSAQFFFRCKLLPAPVSADKHNTVRMPYLIVCVSERLSLTIVNHILLFFSCFSLARPNFFLKLRHWSAGW
jgi:hypothetical protein